MEKFKELVLRFKKDVASMKGKLDKTLKKIKYKKIKRHYEKLISLLKKFKKIFYEKVKFAEEVVWILIPCLLTLCMVLVLKSGNDVQTYSIAENKGEEYYYKGDLDLAVNEYTLMQKSEEWPEYSLEISNIYSHKQDFEKSKSILKESIIIRDKLNKENVNLEKSQRDEDFINKILFIFNMNKEYDETITLGEQYLSEKGYSNKIIKNVFTAYFIKNYEYKIEELLKNFTVEEGSVEDRVDLANMIGLMGNMEGAIELLKEAFEINPKSILIYDTIEELFEFNKDSLIKVLEEKNNKEDFYKFMMLKAYSLSDNEENINKGKDIYLEVRKEDKENYIINLIGYSIYKDVDYLEYAYKNTKDEEEYIEAYVKALYQYNTGNFKSAENEVYRSINLNDNYNKGYLLLTDIMNKNKNNKSAEIYLREALEKKPYSYKTILKIEDFYSNILVNDVNGRFYIDIAINMKKEDSSLYYKLAKLDMAIENYEDAIVNLKKAITLEPENNNYHRILGTLNFEIGNYDEGIEAIRYAYQINENDVLALNNAAWFYINIDRDVYRAYDNIKSAYEEMPLSISEEDKLIIIENYNTIKSLYESGDEDYTDIDLKLIY